MGNGAMRVVDDGGRSSPAPPPPPALGSVEDCAAPEQQGAELLPILMSTIPIPQPLTSPSTCTPEGDGSCHVQLPQPSLGRSTSDCSDAADASAAPATPRRHHFSATLPPSALQPAPHTPPTPLPPIFSPTRHASTTPLPFSPPLPPSTPSPTSSPPWQLDSNEHRSLICRFCGGPSCKHEDWTRQPQHETASSIRGLHSSYILPTLIGMQRPSSRLIALHSIHAQLVSLNVTAIINLQVAGEHSLCGDGIHPHGFSYHPDELAPCHHYAFGWVDMGVPSVERMMNVVQVIDMHQRRGGKVAVHCHAGYGRTGMVAACYLVFSHHYSPEVAIATVRAKREGSVQTREQQRFVQRFAAVVKAIRCHYPTLHPAEQHAQQQPNLSPKLQSLPTSPASAGLPPLSPSPLSPPPHPTLLPPLSLSTLLTHQRIFLHGHERTQYRYASKLVALLTSTVLPQAQLLCDELIRRAQGGAREVHTGPRARSSSFLLDLPFDWAATWTLQDASALDKLKQLANLDDYSQLQRQSPFIVLVALLHFLDSLATPLLPFASLSPHLPTSLSQSFAQIPRRHLPTLHLLMNALHGLHAAALPHSSDSLPLSSFLLLSFAFAFLHPAVAIPSALRLCLPRRSEEGVAGASECVRTSGDDEAGGGLNGVLCFMSVLLAEWQEEYSGWQTREEAERQQRRVGVKKGERWWLEEEQHSRAAALPLQQPREEEAADAKYEDSTRPSREAPTADGERSTEAATSSPHGGVSAECEFTVSEPLVQATTGAEPLTRPSSGAHTKQRALQALTPRLTPRHASRGQATHTEEAGYGKAVEMEEKEEQQPAGATIISAVSAPLPAGAGRRGSGHRPLLPPIRTSSRTGSAVATSVTADGG